MVRPCELQRVSESHVKPGFGLPISILKPQYTFMANLKFDIVIKLKVKQCQELWLNNMFTSGLKVTVDCISAENCLCILPLSENALLICVVVH